MLPALQALLLSAVLPTLPAVVALVAWSEGSHRLKRQFGSHLLWEAAAAVAIGLAALLYFTFRVSDDELVNVLGLAATAAGGVVAVTVLAPRLRRSGAGSRFVLAMAIALVGFYGSLLLVAAFCLWFQAP